MTTRFIPTAGGSAPAGDDPPAAHLSASQLEQFRRALDEQRRFRIDQLRELDASAAGHHDDGPLTEVATALRVAARAALAEVEAAIVRFDLDEFGICQHCGRDIAVERLEIVPMAALCMACQRAAEAGEADAVSTPHR